MKIVILDDSRTDAYLASKVAEQFFDTVVVCGTPADLHSALKAGAPDFILLDVQVGDSHSGISELATIKERYDASSSVPTIMVTASSDEAVHKFALTNGADGVIVKPITAEALTSHLQVLLPAALTR